MKRKVKTTRLVIVVPMVVFATLLAGAGQSGVTKKMEPPVSQRTVHNPSTLRGVIKNLSKQREEFERMIKQIREKIGEDAVLDWKAENETVDLYLNEIIPWLRDRRSEIMDNKAPIKLALVGYLHALESAIDALRATERRDDDPMVRSDRIRKYRGKLSAAAGTVAVKYLERRKAARSMVEEVQEFLVTVEDSEGLLDEWEGILLAMNEAGDSGELALGAIESLRSFARDFQEAFDSFLQFSEKMDYRPPESRAAERERSAISPDA